MLRMDCVTFRAACGLRPPLYCFNRKNALASKHFLLHDILYLQEYVCNEHLNTHKLRTGGSNMKDLKYNSENGKVTIYLTGRIDTNNAQDTEKSINDILSENSGAEPVFDVNDLEYISSAGLRVLMRIRKTTGKELDVINASSDLYEIFDTTGFTEILNVSKKMREISVEGCKIIGRGYYGTVYRIDEETIVKVYKSADSLSMIKNEQRLAKTALIAGVPTAISYDIVRVGDSYGSVFELLNAKTLNDLLIERPDDTDSIIKQYADFLHIVNDTTVEPGRLDSAKQAFLRYLETARAYLSAEIYERVKELIEEIPEQHNVIHGDSQMKNIMLVDNEPMLIDMDTLTEGHPIFDLQSVYITYFAFEEDDENNSMDFLGIGNDVAAKVWNDFIGYYFETKDEKRISELRDKISVLGCIRFIFLLSLGNGSEDKLFKLRIKHTVQRLKELLARVTTLLF